MKTNKLIFTGALFSIYLYMAGCAPPNGTSTGNPDATVELQVQGTGPGSLAAATYFKAGAFNVATLDLTVTDSLGNPIGTLTLTKANVALRGIEIVASDAIGRDIESDFPGPFVADLLMNSISPSLGSAALPAGTYDEIILDLHKIAGDETDDSGDTLIPPSDPLYDNSIYLEGTYSGQTAVGTQNNVPFRLSFDLSEEFQLGGPSPKGFLLEGGQVQTVIIAFRLNSWLRFNNPDTNSDGISFADLSPNANGEIVLDKNSAGTAATARDVLKENIKESADFGKDENGDGILDGSEDSDSDSEDIDDA